MKLSVLERLLVAERPRRRASFSEPIVDERSAELFEQPWVVTNTKGDFVRTHRTPRSDGASGFTRQGYVECPLEDEDSLLARFFESMALLCDTWGWENRCETLAEAEPLLVRLGFEPRNLVVPFSLLAEICGRELSEEEADRLTLAKGCVAEVDGVRVISARSALPDGTAILSTTPSLVGSYTRVADHLAITVHRADRAMILVGNG
jgi:hypothetical protein